MINKKAVITVRQKIGLYLKTIREDKQLTCYAVAKLADLYVEQVQSIERGNKAYTIDSFLKITHALGVCFFTEDKNSNHLNFIDVAEKAIHKKREGK